jgi:hypothetical protein
LSGVLVLEITSSFVNIEPIVVILSFLSARGLLDKVKVIITCRVAIQNHPRSKPLMGFIKNPQSQGQIFRINNGRFFNPIRNSDPII